MIHDHPELQRRYRAPRAFGPMPGPRNIPLPQQDGTGKPPEITTSLAVSLEADPAELTRLLPPGTRLAGPAVLTVTATRFENLVWLAGRGYPILTVTLPVETVGTDAVAGRYLAVLWEGMADPVTTGRDELGFPKLFADIRAPRVEDVSVAGAVDAEAAWEGFRFLDLSATGLVDVDLAGPPPQATIVHRYVPSPTSVGEADIDQLLLHERSAVPGTQPTTTHRRTGTGTFAFRPARFEDSPIQYPVVNTLAALTLAGSGPAVLSRSTVPAGGPARTDPPRVLRVSADAAEPVTVS